MTSRVALAALMLAGCGDPNGPPPVTRLEIHAAPTIVDQCDDEDLTAWAVRVRETGAHVSGACGDALVLSDLEPYEHYTLEITGYAAQALCWRGECQVAPLPGLGLADCPHVARNVCTNANAR